MKIGRATRSMRWLLCATALTLLAGACSNSTDDEPAASGNATSDASDTTEAADAGEASDDDTAASTEGGVIECLVADGNMSFDLLVTNESPEPVSFRGEVESFDGDTLLGVTDILIEQVAPNEVVREYFLMSNSSSAATSCSTDGVSAKSVSIPLIGSDDVGPCENLRESEFGTFAYELTTVNSSDQVAAEYTVYVAIRNELGERRSTRLLLVKWEEGATSDLAPGESWTRTDQTLGAPFAEGHTCEVVSVDKRSSEDFFSSDTGVATGSLSSDVGFATGSAELTEDALVVLQGPIEEIISNGGPVCIEGYADSVGDDDVNLELSQQRAESVASQLQTAGVTNEIDAIGYGEADATADEVDDPTLRRVDITLAFCEG